MKEKIIEKRYAEAYLGFAKSQIGLAACIEDLKNLKRILYANQDFYEFLNNPEISFSDKCELIDKVLQDCIHLQTRQFLKLLMEKGRQNHIVGICDYVRVTYAHGDTVEALLRTSYPLDLEFVESIKLGLEKRLNRKLNLYLELDPDLLGGVQIKIGNIIVDGSVRRRLDELKEKLKTAQIN